MIVCICLSTLIQTDINIILNKSCHYLVRAPQDSGPYGTIFLFHEGYNSVTIKHSEGITCRSNDILMI